MAVKQMLLAAATVVAAPLVGAQNCWSSPEEGPCGPDSSAAGSWILQEEFSDEFSGSTVDTSKWTKSFPGWSGRAPGANSAANVVANGDHLSLLGNYEPGYSFPENDESCSCSYEEYTTAVLMSTFTVFEGRFEIRAKVAPSSFLSSFWLQGSSSEIGVFEAVGNSTVNASSAHYMDTTNHCFNSTALQSSSVETHSLGDQVDISAGYHVYGIEWGADTITYYLDGNAIQSITSTSCNSEPHHLILSLETVVDKGLPNVASLASGGASEFAVDYVRAWTFQPAPTAAPTETPTCEMEAHLQFEATGPTALMKMKRPQPARRVYDIGVKSVVANINACALLCVEEGSGCHAIEYRADKGLCMLKNTFPTQRLRKPNAKWSLWPRELYCTAPAWTDPTGCTSEPITRFQQVAGTKIGGTPPESVPAASATDCATVCVQEGLGCLLFTYNTVFNRCYLYADRMADQTRVRSNIKFDLYDREVTCCGSGCASGLEGSVNEAAEAPAPSVTWVVFAVGLTLAAMYTRAQRRATDDVVVDAEGLSEKTSLLLATSPQSTYSTTTAWGESAAEAVLGLVTSNK